MRLLSLLFFLIIGLICIWLAVANRSYVTVSLEPLPSALDLPLFFVFLFGVFIGLLAIGPGAAWRRFSLNRKLKKAQAQYAALQNTLDATLAERDHLAARVRPEDDKYAAAQEIEMSPVSQAPMLPGEKL